jgi:hypothetical protein
MKESNAFALFPGGFGTQDEAFELLTLIQTGKSPLSPIVLIEAPGTGYWDKWLDFVRGTLLEGGMIGPHDLSLFKRLTTVTEAATEVCDFYRVYHSQRYVGDRLVLRLSHAIGPTLVERLNDEFGDIVVSGTIDAIEATEPEIATDDHVDLPRLRLHFDRRSHGRLRQMVDAINQGDVG